MTKRMRKGNHPSNPYADEVATAARLEDRDGWPFPAPRGKPAATSDEAWLGRQLPSPRAPPASVKGDEPTFVLRASDPLSGMLVRFWAAANEYPAAAVSPKDTAAARALAARMDDWRERHK
jgi:hypothetical protein